MKPVEYEVHPHWKFLSEYYGMETAFSLFGPYVGAAVKIHILDKNTVESVMELIPTNTNYVGTHFGGSLYSMCDPFFMFILIENLGPDYIVWDKGATIDFVKPGRGTVRARFQISAEEIEDIRKVVKEKRKTEREYLCEVRDEAGTLIAKVKKLLYIRRILREEHPQ